MHSQSRLSVLAVALLLCSLAPFALTRTKDVAKQEADAANLEVNFVNESGEKVDTRQFGSWVDMQNLSTHEWKSVHALVYSVQFLDLNPGKYRLWVRRKQSRFDGCGVRKESWKMTIKPGQNSLAVTVHFINNAGCAVE